MKKRIFIIAALAVAAGIFLVTRSPGATGGSTYEWIARELPVGQQSVPWVNYFFRKAMHLMSFGGLAVLLSLILKRRRYLLPWLIVTIYAATDEVHQLYVPGRSGSIKDVLLDSFGAACGLGILFLIRRRRSR